MAFISTRAPFRVSFFGGGTDYPSWYQEEGGAVISTTIDKYCYITCRYLPPFFSQRFRIVWSHIENVSSIAEILHPAVREGLRMLGFEDSPGVELHHFSDLPARSGMGSSSAFANALLLALGALQGNTYDQTTLFQMAIDLEQNRLRENVGSQDQVASAVGGLNVIQFHRNSRIEVTPIHMEPQRLRQLEDNLILVYTGSKRLSSEIAGKIIASLPHRKENLRRMRDMVDEAHTVLMSDGPLDDFGAMLHETWERKRRLCADISNDFVDQIYRAAQQEGAIGGKLLGAGSSGFMLFYADPERQPAVQRALNHLLNVPFRFEFEGAQLTSGIQSPMGKSS